MFEFICSQLPNVNPWLIIMFILVVGTAFIIFIIKIAVKEALRNAIRDTQFREDLRNQITYANIRAIEQSRGKSTQFWESDKTI